MKMLKRVLALMAIACLLLGAIPAAADNVSGTAKPYLNTALSNTVVNVKTSSGTVLGWSFVNKGGAEAYVQVFDSAAANVTLGTTTPKLVVWIPAGGAWEEKFTGETKVGFYTAISLAATTTATGSSAPGTALIANIEYK